MGKHTACLEKEFLTSVKADPQYQELETALLMGKNLGFLEYRNILNTVLLLSWNWMKPYMNELSCLRTRVTLCDKKRRQAALMHLKELNLSQQLMSLTTDKDAAREHAMDVTFFDAMMFEDEDMRELVQQSVLKLWDHISSSRKDGEKSKTLMKPALVSQLEKMAEKSTQRLLVNAGPGALVTQLEKMEEKPTQRLLVNAGPGDDGTARRSPIGESGLQWKIKYDQAVVDAEEQKKRYEEIIEKLRRSEKTDEFKSATQGLSADSAELTELQSKLAQRKNELAVQKNQLDAGRLEVEQVKLDAASRVEGPSKGGNGLTDDVSSAAPANAKQEMKKKMREEMEGTVKKEIEVKVKEKMKEKMKEEMKEMKDMKSLLRVKDAQIADLPKRCEESTTKELTDGSVAKVKRLLVDDLNGEQGNDSADEVPTAEMTRHGCDHRVPLMSWPVKTDRRARPTNNNEQPTRNDNQQPKANNCHTIPYDEDDRSKLLAKLQEISQEKEDLNVRIVQLDTVVGEMGRKLHEFRNMLGNQVGDATMDAKLDELFDVVGLSDLMKCSSDAKVFERLHSDATHRLNRLEVKRMRCLEELKQVTLRLIESKLLLSTEKELYVGQRVNPWQESLVDHGKRASSAGGYQRKESLCPDLSKRRSTRIRITDEYYRAHLQRSAQFFHPEEPCQLETRAITPNVLPNVKSLTHLVKYGK